MLNRECFCHRPPFLSGIVCFDTDQFSLGCRLCSSWIHFRFFKIGCIPQQLWWDIIRDNICGHHETKFDGRGLHPESLDYNRRAHFDCAIRAFVRSNRPKWEPISAITNLARSFS